METCPNCGQSFKPLPIAAIFAKDIPMERHGEMGILKAKPLLCEACCELPAKELAAIILRLNRAP